jgi:hypothetical protein
VEQVKCTAIEHKSSKLPTEQTCLHTHGWCWQSTYLQRWSRQGQESCCLEEQIGYSSHPTQRPPPPHPPPQPQPPPHPSTANNAAADADANVAAAALATINESLATRTRQRLMLAIQSGSDAATGRRGCDDNVLDNSPARRTRQRLGKLDAEVPIPPVPATLVCKDYLAHRQELELTRTAI